MVTYHPHIRLLPKRRLAASYLLMAAAALPDAFQSAASPALCMEATRE